MSEWWTYNPFEMLMFSPQAYWRLVDRYQREWWPQPLLMPLLGLACGLLVTRISTSARRAGWMLLAIIWAWVGWAFHWQRYAEIFLGAPWLAGSAWLQAGVLLTVAVWPADAHAPSRGAAGVGALMGTAAFAYPLAWLVMGHTWQQAEFFGSLPDPTALGTLGLLAVARGLAPPVRIAAAVLPVLTLAWGWGTLWAMAH